MRRQRGAKEISEERRKTVLDMHEIVVRQFDTVRYYKMPQSTVSKVTRRGQIQKRTKNSGPKMKLTSRATRTLLKTISENKFQSSSVLTPIYNRYAPVPIIARTVHKTLKRNGIQTMLEKI